MKALCSSMHLSYCRPIILPVILSHPVAFSVSRREHLAKTTLLDYMSNCNPKNKNANSSDEILGTLWVHEVH